MGRFVADVILGFRVLALMFGVISREWFFAGVDG